MCRCRAESLCEDFSRGIPLQCVTCVLSTFLYSPRTRPVEYFDGGLGGDKDLQEPFLRAHLTAALAKGEGEIHVGELPDVGVVGVTIW